MGNGRAIAKRALMALLSACLMMLAACAPAGPDVPARDSLDAYSWEELSAISAQIADAADDAAAREVAVRYGLAGSDGTLDGTQEKALVLADGTKARAVLVGIRHDTAADGGTAGLTFAFAEAVAVRGMNNNAGLGEFTSQDDTDAIGGWAASDVRRWLNGEFVQGLPADLAAVLVPVEKATSAVPEFELGGVSDQGTVDFSADGLVLGTVDTLWLPSVVELSGVDDASQAAQERPEWMAVLRAEGTPYELFADGNAALLQREADGGPCSWWLRSVENGSFASVDADGAIDRSEQASGGTAQGVVPFFAI